MYRSIALLLTLFSFSVNSFANGISSSGGIMLAKGTRSYSHPSTPRSYSKPAPSKPVAPRSRKKSSGVVVASAATSAMFIAAMLATRRHSQTTQQPAPQPVTQSPVVQGAQVAPDYSSFREPDQCKKLYKRCTVQERQLCPDSCKFF